MPSAVRPSIRRFLLVTLLGLAGGTTGCGGAQSTEIDVEAPTTTRLVRAPDGRLTLADDHARHARRGWFRLLPQHWPNAAGPPPVLGVGRVVREGEENVAVVWGTRQTDEVTAQWVDVMRRPEALTDSKVLATVTAVDGNTFTIARGREQGVRDGDRYFIMNREPTAPQRLGDFVGGIARVVALEDASATLAIMHAEERVQSGDLVRFGHVAPDDESEAVTIAVARFCEATADQTLPAVVEPIPELMSTYGLSNIGVLPLEIRLDPRPADAPDLAIAAAPDEGYGVLAFGELNDDGVTYNVTAFGESPYPVTTIGVLEGGLVLEGQTVETVAVPISHALLAGALSLSGEPAIAAYVAEQGARGAVPSGLRYHLHEQLAVAYEQVGIIEESMAAMRLDIARAEAEGDTLALLNALSVRGGLASELGDDALALQDAQRYLELAPSVQSDEATFYPRIRLARLLSRTGDESQARALYESMMSAEAPSALEQYVLALDLSLFYFGLEDTVASLILIGDAERALDQALAERLLTTDDAAAFHALTASLYAALTLQAQAGQDGPQSLRDLREEAQSHYRQAQELLDGASPDTIAHVAGLLSDIEAGFGHTETAFELSWLAASSELRSAQFVEAINRMADLSMILLETASPDGSGFDAYLEALQTSQVASEVAIRIGRDADAALLMMYQATIYWRLGEADTAMETLSDALTLARSVAHYRLLATLTEMQAEMAQEQGDTTLAEAARAEAEMWRASATLAESAEDDVD